MFEDMTFEKILSDALSMVPDAYDKRIGSVIYDAIAPAAAELATVYVALDCVINETFADTASLFYLRRRCAERGITQEEATKAVLKGEFTPTTVSIPTGTRFTCGSLSYAVTEMIEAGKYKLECETAGTDGNAVFGQLIPVEYVQDLETAELTELLIPAQDDETVDELRERYFESVEAQSYGGNITDYVTKTESIDGVGGCKCIPVWNGGGTVKLIIVDSTYGVPSSEVISLVKETIDPTAYSGKGYGYAPIGHTVTVVGAESVSINITATISYASGKSWETEGAAIKAAIDDYFLELCKAWKSSDNTIVRIGKVESAILSCSGVADVESLKINTSTGNIQLESNQIPVRGTFNGS